MRSDLDALLHPRSIAVVGASPDPEKMGHRYVRILQEAGFPGSIYPIHPRAPQILGLKAYPSLLAVPGRIDYVISSIPASNILEVVDQCVRKGVRLIHSYTARFSETGRPDAAQLEQEFLRRARQAGIRIIGPNCMGLYYPKMGISFKHGLPKEAGPVGMLSQSGGNAVEMVWEASLRGLRFSKVISYGNAADLNEADFMEYFADDLDTRVICAYIEGAREGRRFFQALRKASKSKPVIVLKGGRTLAGHRAVASHTASLAGERQLWQALVRQAGAIWVDTLEEMIDTAIACAFCKPSAGVRVGVVGGGGGRSVASADDCEEAGLRVVPIPDDMRQVWRELDPSLADWLSNPADGSILLGSPLTVERVLGMMADHPAFDLLIANVGEHFPLEHPDGVPRTRATVQAFIQIAQRACKPVAVVLGDTLAHQPWQREIIRELRETLAAAGVATFPTVRRAARSLARLATYYRERDEEESPHDGPQAAHPGRD
ncbi:MAG: CoA-binding protein [Dehalococcoidia bacterium]|nr:CoA-binding protein [Dehalococcoidia bacterium]MDW8119276.1 CoA-binding protein [Chloroflexota bacterium]